MNSYTLVEGRQRELEAGGRRFSPIVILILYTNDATGHDMTSDLRVALYNYLAIQNIRCISYAL
ncbi:MAG: hypothetical protein F6K17_13295 [Okeania sp. SIO3C4]|nr:hypothetical protein [Okeania sp. SIO3B3]NER03516.1 hypothetical protein [Okeania sp. SIO3C4]